MGPMGEEDGGGVDKWIPRDGRLVTGVEEYDGVLGRMGWYRYGSDDYYQLLDPVGSRATLWDEGMGPRKVRRPVRDGRVRALGPRPRRGWLRGPDLAPPYRRGRFAQGNSRVCPWRRNGMGDFFFLPF